MVSLKQELQRLTTVYDLEVDSLWQKLGLEDKVLTVDDAVAVINVAMGADDLLDNEAKALRDVWAKMIRNQRLIPRCSPAGMLAHPLPSATRGTHCIEVPSTSGRDHELTPTTLKEWTTVRPSHPPTHPPSLTHPPTTLKEWTAVRPDDPDSNNLMAEIKEHQRNADSVYSGNLRLELPRLEVHNPFDNEGAVAGAWRHNVLEMVSPLASAAAGAATTVTWRMPDWEELIEDVTRYYLACHGPMQREAAPAPQLRSNPDCTVQPQPGSGGEATSSAAHTTSTKRKPEMLEFVLTVEGEAEPQQPPFKKAKVVCEGQVQAAPVKQTNVVCVQDQLSEEKADQDVQEPKPKLKAERQVVCVGGVHAGLSEGVDESPLDLLHAFNTPGHEHRGVAVAIVKHVYTYMQLWDLQYSFITSWFATWLVYCPPNARTTLYISPVIKALDRDPTPHASMAWLQKQALDTRHEQVQHHPGLPATAPAGADGGGGDASGSTQAADDGNGDIELLERICFGEAGSVVHARYHGIPAVIKLFGPGTSAVYRREVGAYQRLQHHQGTLIPRLLGAGYLVPGVQFVALSAVKGATLASLGGNNYQPAAAAAALQALATLQSVDGFLHGDAHLNNIMLVPNETATDAAPACVFIDLGRARFGASVEQQREEMEELERLLKA